MKKQPFTIGDRVGFNAIFKDQDTYNDCDAGFYDLAFDEYYDPCYGEVIEIIEPSDNLIIKWDENDDYIDEYKPEDGWNAKDFLPEKELKKKYSHLEKEFRTMEKAVKAKVKKAAVIIREANKMTKEHGKTLSELWDVRRPLYDAMDNAGWHTSSFDCP